MKDKEQADAHAGKVHVLDPFTFEIVKGNEREVHEINVSTPKGYGKQPEGMVFHGVFNKWMPKEDAYKEYWVDPKEIGLSDKDLNMDEDEDVEQ